MSDDGRLHTRRNALKCMAYGVAGTLFALSGGVFTPIDLAMAAADKQGPPKLGKPLFVQISDTHVGFNKEVNPDVMGTFTQTIDLVNGMADQPALIIHTGDITHLSKPAEFDLAQQMFARLRTTELHTVPGEHDTTDEGAAEYFKRFGKASRQQGTYSQLRSFGRTLHRPGQRAAFKPGGLGKSSGSDQLAWLEADLKGVSSSTPVVVFAHMPLCNYLYEPWGWGTGDADQLMTHLRAFSVRSTVLNGHIHQIVQKVEGNVTFHTARSAPIRNPRRARGPDPALSRYRPMNYPGCSASPASRSRSVPAVWRLPTPPWRKGAPASMLPG